MKLNAQQIEKLKDERAENEAKIELPGVFLWIGFTVRNRSQHLRCGRGAYKS